VIETAQLNDEQRRALRILARSSDERLCRERGLHAEDDDLMQPHPGGVQLAANAGSKSRGIRLSSLGYEIGVSDVENPRRGTRLDAQRNEALPLVGWIALQRLGRLAYAIRMGLKMAWTPHEMFTISADRTPMTHVG
jgi:hypothetical protein